MRTFIHFIIPNIFLLFAHSVFAQDTTNIKKRSILKDTVIIYDEPYILKKTIYYRDKKRDRNPFWTEFSFSPLVLSEKYRPCPGWESYVALLQKTTSPQISYLTHFGILTFLNRFMFGLGIEYVIYKEKFRYGESYICKNTYQYVNLPLSIGYRFGSAKFKIIPIFSYNVAYLLKVKGSSLTEEYTPVISDINRVRNYHFMSYRGTGSVNFISSLSPKTSVGLQPFYDMDLRSVTKGLGAFKLNRSTWGIKVQMFYAIR